MQRVTIWRGADAGIKGISTGVWTTAYCRWRVSIGPTFAARRMGIMGAPWLRGRVDAGWGILPTPGALPEEGRRYRPSGEWCLDDGDWLLCRLQWKELALITIRRRRRAI